MSDELDPDVGGWAADIEKEMPGAAVRQITLTISTRGKDVAVRVEGPQLISYLEARSIVARILAPLSEEARIHACADALTFLKQIGPSPGDRLLPPEGHG